MIISQVDIYTIDVPFGQAVKSDHWHNVRC